jgi:hypothetical protein
MRRTVLLAILALIAACKPAALSETVVASRENLVYAHVPKGEGWHCSANDTDKQTFQVRGVKCVYDGGVVLNAKLIDVDTGDARNADLFCIQDWKSEYKNVFKGVMKYTHDVVDWRGVPACRVELVGSSSKGPWSLLEIHAPNGRRLAQVTMSGSTPVVEKQRAAIDAWWKDVHMDLTLPGQ